jgi:tRNA U34 5-methylaminomethyl-2-thiouridine-forming methyltransferase MnmC
MLPEKIGRLPQQKAYGAAFAAAIMLRKSIYIIF